MNSLSKKIYETNVKKGFWDKEFNMGEKLMLITSELSEALEVDRKDENKSVPGGIKSYMSSLKSNEDDKFKPLFESWVKDTLPDEFADVIIRVLDLCGHLEIDIDWHIRMKMKYNQLREYKHGKKY